VWLQIGQVSHCPCQVGPGISYSFQQWSVAELPHVSWLRAKLIVGNAIMLTCTLGVPGTRSKLGAECAIWASAPKRVD
jgi:hypothetical protein